jgi:hypothetical protein
VRFRADGRSAEAFSDVVKRPVPRKAVRSLSLREASPLRKWREELGTHEVRVHAVRLGGRSRLDASRVFSTGRSQGLLVNQRGR